MPIVKCRSFNFILFCSCSRYQNGRLLQEVTLGMRSNLFIPNVNGAQGFYTCKATNDYGSEISTSAELKIQGTLCFVTIASWFVVGIVDALVLLRFAENVGLWIKNKQTAFSVFRSTILLKQKAKQNNKNYLTFRYGKVTNVE